METYVDKSKVSVKQFIEKARDMIIRNHYSGKMSAVDISEFSTSPMLINSLMVKQRISLG